jgi:hypothetical protein
MHCNNLSVTGMRCQLKKGHKGMHEHIERIRWEEYKKNDWVTFPTTNGTVTFKKKRDK